MKRYTPKSDLRILLERQRGTCKHCRDLLSTFHIDHIIALGLGGTDTLANKQLLCPICHKLKSFGSKATSYRSDIHAIAKVKRLLDKAKKLAVIEVKGDVMKFITPKRKWPSRKMASRPFAKR